MVLVWLLYFDYLQIVHNWIKKQDKKHPSLAKILDAISVLLGALIAIALLWKYLV